MEPPDLETRALRPEDVPPPTPNATVPPASNPGTVGYPESAPGDPNGLEFIDEGPGGLIPRSLLLASPWAGWPAEWSTPLWRGRVDDLTDIAWGCVDLNASLLATMPPYLVGASPTLPNDWMGNPDPDVYSSWEEFAKQLFWDFQLGEVFVICTARYSNGWPARFHVVSPWLVNVDMVGGLRRYSIGGLDVTGDMLHIRYQSRVDDAHGHGPLEAGWARVIAARVFMRYATNLAEGGGIPHSVLKHPDELTKTQSEALQAQWVEARMSSLGFPAVLSGGIEFETLQFSPTDMALLDISKHTESRICVLLGVPPFLMGLPSGGDSMTYNTTESLYGYHWRTGLKPRAQTVMAAMSLWLTPHGTALELNRDAYVQPGPLERAQVWQILIGLGVLTAEQVATIERYTVSGFVPTGVL